MRQTNLTQVLNEGQYVKCLMNGRGQVVYLNRFGFDNAIGVYFKHLGVVHYDRHGKANRSRFSLLYPSWQCLPCPEWDVQHETPTYSRSDVVWLMWVGAGLWVVLVGILIYLFLS